MHAYVRVYACLCVRARARATRYAVVCEHACVAAIYHTFMVSTTTAAAYQRLLLFDMLGIWLIQTVRRHTRTMRSCRASTYACMRTHARLLEVLLSAVVGSTHAHGAQLLCATHHEVRVPRASVQGAGIAHAHLIMPCASMWGLFALSGLPALLAAFWILVVARTPSSRALAFAAQIVTRIGLIAITATLQTSHWTGTQLLRHAFVETAPIVGTIVNVLRFPERWYPRRFDLYLQSHTIMHILVAIPVLTQRWLYLDRAEHIMEDPVHLACVQATHDAFGSLLA